jgi:hypothetical protein
MLLSLTCTIVVCLVFSIISEDTRRHGTIAGGIIGFVGVLLCQLWKCLNTDIRPSSLLDVCITKCCASIGSSDLSNQRRNETPLVNENVPRRCSSVDNIMPLIYAKGQNVTIEVKKLFVNQVLWNPSMPYHHIFFIVAQ